jgi:two-component system cell cycle response regulator
MANPLQHLRVLILEDDVIDFRLLQSMLDGREADIGWVHVTRLAEALQHLGAGGFDVLVLDLNVPDSQGLETFLSVHEAAPETPTVVLTGQDDQALALKAVEAGAQDYLMKGQVDGGLLLRALRYAMQRQALQVELRRQALHDDLTGLHNRRAFLMFAEQQVRLAQRNRQVMLIFFADVDGLKAINDTRGHEAGSQALRDTAEVLRQTIRESDVAARWGGDEFVVLAIEAQPGAPQVILERFEANLKRHNERAQRPFVLSVSIGFKELDPAAGQTLEAVMAEADAAMYARKRTSRYEP